MKGIILFDGICNLCNSSVQFIIKRDPNEQFIFASLQSETAKKLLDEHNVTKQMDSIVLLDKNGKIYEKSTAALRIAKKLKGGFKLFSILLVIPPLFRNPIYSLIAKYRYHWFGKKNQCMIPTPEQRQRFLD